jgi:hypothetical protein
MTWDKPQIVQKLRQLNKAGKNLSYNAMSRSNQALLSAAAYHFGSYRKAVESAGIDYASVLRRPRWTKQAIIKLIKDARRRNEDLHWAAVTKRRDELGKAAFASLQPRLFGRWDRALQAAGLDAEEVARYRKWDRNEIIFELKSRAQESEPLNSGAIQKEDPGLHAAAVRHFGSYDRALKAAKLDPMKFRQRRAWNRSEVTRSLRAAQRAGKGMSDSSVRKDDPALYGAAVRLFGAFTKAREAAGIRWTRETKKTRKTSKKRK